MKKDIRWLQGLDSFTARLKQLANAMALMEERELSDLEKQWLKLFMIQSMQLKFTWV